MCATVYMAGYGQTWHFILRGNGCLFIFGHYLGTLWVLLVGLLIIVSVYYVDFHYWRSGSPDMIAREFLEVKSAWY